MKITFVNESVLLSGDMNEKATITFGSNGTAVVEIEPSSNSVVDRVVRILRCDIENYDRTQREEFSRKIYLIKVLRTPVVSEILIKAGMVPMGDVQYAGTPNETVGLRFAKEWVETHCKDLL